MNACDVYRLDDLTIDLARRRVERAGRALDVSGLSFDLLAFLVSRGGDVMSFDDLIAGVWAPAVVGEETVSQRVKLLRQALGDDSRRPRYIRSVRGRGYQLAVPPQPAEAAPVGVQPKRRRALAIGAVAVLALGVAAAWYLHTRMPATAPPRENLVERARYYAGIGQDENNERAIALYEEALAHDATNVPAMLGLSHALSARVCLYNREPRWLDRADALAEAVLAAHPGDSLAHGALAYAYDCRGRIDSAIREYERAIALDPAARNDSLASVAHLYAVKGRLAEALHADLAAANSAEGLHFLELQIARTLELLGYAAQAEQRYARIFELYPDNVFANAAYPRNLWLQGRYADAQAALARAIARPPHPTTFLLEGELALVRGDRAAAGAAFARAAALRPHQSMPATLARLYAAEPPDPAWLRARLEAERRDLETDEHWPDDWLEIALIEIALEDRAGATAALERAAAEGYRDGAYLRTSALFRPL
ncbi:MAG TPA: winged helix-turn-helix domain-containing protein, partial [Rudaea sp.]|nr:winged helix-turn-helix domain-containing protein [Rudaea sp.]